MNKTNKRWMVFVLSILLLLTSFIGLINMSEKAYAVTNDLSDEMYTSSDNLLKSNGSLSERDIINFAEDV